MSHNANAGLNVADIYKSVISDVISQVKEAFLDENVDIDILNQLKKEWEEKVAQSGCVDMEARPVPGSMRNIQQNAPSARNSTTAPAPATTTTQQQPAQPVPQSLPSQIRIQPSTHQILAGQHMQMQNLEVQQTQGGQTQPVQLHIQRVQVPQAQHVVQPRPVFVQGHSGMQHIHGIPIQAMSSATGPGMYPQLRPLTHVMPHQAIQGYPIMHSSQLQGVHPHSVMLLSNGEQIPVVGGAAVLQGQRLPMQLEQAQQHPANNIHQIDGNAPFEEDKDGPPFKPSKKTTAKEAERIARHLFRALQMDGNGMSDSSSEEEDDEDEDDDPLRRMANRIGEEGAEDAEGGIVEEDPLNSGDDQSDDEDVETLFDADNVVMCQFEKVHRARSKWKFSLKDGIMHINGKDYCFQKCTGEAEW